MLEGLSEAKKRALLLADNKIADNAGWDRERLAIELPELTELLIDEDLDISITGFEPVEIDQILKRFRGGRADPADAVESAWHVGSGGEQARRPLAARQSSTFCAATRAMAIDLDRLMGRERAAMAFLDPPYNVQHQERRRAWPAKHGEFAMASGEMSRTDFTAFLEETLGNAARVSREGAVHFVCMDWRHVGELIEAGQTVYGDMLNLVVWDKTNAGQGSFYRSQHELIGVFRVGDTQHLNNIELGRHGRSRSNVWHYAGGEHLPGGANGRALGSPDS